MGRKSAATQRDRDGSNLLPGLAIGLAIGVGIGLLVAPRPGRQTLDLVLDKADQLRDAVAEFLEEARAIARVAELRARGFPGSP